MELLQYTFFQHALLGSLLASIACGLVGTYIVTRRLVFISGGLTHASFGGIGLGLYTGIPPILSAAVFAVLSAFGVEWLSKRKDMREDSAIAVFWTLGMALGIAKVIYDKPMVWFVGPILVLLFVLVFVSKDFYASVAFDCAAATTGPVNIPINAAISLGLATAMGLDPMRVGFGLVGLSCLGAATSVMLAPMATRLIALFVR